MQRFTDLIIRRRGWIIGLTIAITAVLGWLALRVPLNGDFATYLDQFDPVVREYNRVGDIFGSNATGVVLVTAEDVFSRDVMDVVGHLTDSLERVDGVTGVISLTNVVDFRQTDWGLEVARLITDDSDQTAATRRAYILSEERYRGTLVSDDGTATAILVRFAGGVNQYVTAMRVNAAATAVFTAEQLPPDAAVYFGGMPFLVFNMTEMIAENLLYLVPLMILLLVGILLVGFRHWAGVAFPLLVVGVSVIWVVGIMGLVGLEFDLLTGIMPVVLLALGSADAIHLLKRYFEHRRDGLDGDLSARASLRDMGTPIVLTTVTSMAGFASLVISDFVVIRQFGALTAVGVLVALVVTLTLLPALLSFELRVPAGRRRSGVFYGLLDRFTTFIYRHKKVVLAGGLAVVALSIVAIPRIVKDVDWSLCLARGSSPYHAEMLLREKFGGSLPIQVGIEGDLKDPAVLAIMRRIERRLETVPGVGTAQSMAYFIGEMNRALNGRRTIPETRQGVANLWLLVEDEDVVDQFVAGDERAGLVQARLATWHTAAVVTAVDSVDRLLRTLPERMAVVDLTRVRSVQRRALMEEQTQQIADELAFDFSRFDVSVDRARLEAALLAARRACVSDPATATVADAVRDYLESPEAEFTVSEPAHLASQLGLETDREEITRLIIQEEPAIMEEDARWLATSLSEVVGSAIGNVVVQTGLDALPVESNQDLRVAVTGTLGQINEKALYVAADRALELLDGDLRAVDREVEFTVSQTGMPPVLKQMEVELTPTQLYSLLMALGFVFVLLGIIFRSAVGAFIAVVPISLTILLNFAVMGYAGIGLDAFTAMIASVAIGLGIDTDIHFVSRLQEELRVDGRYLEALKRTVRTTGVSIVINSAAVGVGFLVLLGAGGQHIRRFGGLTSLTIFASAFFTLTILAVLLIWIRPRFLKVAAEAGSREAPITQVDHDPRKALA